MRRRDLAGIVLLATVLAAIGWLAARSPGYQAILRAQTRAHPPAIGCVWSQPWTDPAFVMDGWSQPQPWWHQPDTEVLWSNARSADILFRLPPGLAGDTDLSIKYPAVAASVAVQVNGMPAGNLDRSAKGNHAPHVFTYRVRTPPDGIIDIRFLTRDATLHDKDGRYLGVLLQALRTCPATSHVPS